MSSEKRPKAIDLSHHVSDFARRYAVSPLKGLQKYYGRDLIALAGGLPSPDYFPFTSVSANILPVDAFPLTVPRASSPASASSSAFGWLWRIFGGGAGRRDDTTTRIEVPREPRPDDGGVNLAAALQYGPATGLPRLQKFMHEFTERVYAPGYDNWTTLVHTGNTDGWGRISKLLLNPGDTLLVEEWTYPSALATALPIDVRWHGVPMDNQGMRADALREILAGWDVKSGPRPRVIYTVPVGQNPCGTTMGLERKKAIYDICVEYDWWYKTLSSPEDDPYFFLQVGEFVPKSQRKAEREPPAGEEVSRFIDSLVPSFLRVDTQGRVIRIDTFSKLEHTTTIAPGARLGWFTCSPLFAERLERIGETSAANPCGLGQALVVALLTQWTFDGTSTVATFSWIVLAEEFELFPAPDPASGGPASLCAYRSGSLDEKTRTTRPLLSFVPPSSGMFVWVKLYFGDVPDKRDESDGSVLTPDRQFWEELAEAGVLVGPGWIFSPASKLSLRGAPPAEADRQIGHVRLSYTPSDYGDDAPGHKDFRADAQGILSCLGFIDRVYGMIVLFNWQNLLGRNG
ncbi:PLP-dependent transferase [Lactarius akahatsu]|uniref:PLP-dependent transferase n=1 Tax=Lactarius akahatsu TaxID=416441 RepID=A0AAD4QCT1_9AGAM|nr:PLP-dependent transferase [Lactarius akahatsu]